MAWPERINSLRSMPRTCDDEIIRGIPLNTDVLFSDWATDNRDQLDQITGGNVVLEKCLGNLLIDLAQTIAGNGTLNAEGRLSRHDQVPTL